MIRHNAAWRKQAFCRDAFDRMYSRRGDDRAYEPIDYGSVDDRGEVSTDEYGVDEQFRNRPHSDDLYEDRG